MQKPSKAHVAVMGASLLIAFICLVVSTLLLETWHQRLENAREASVMVLCEDGSGSGVVFQNGQNVFVWTDAHVVSDCIASKEIIDPETGLTKVVPEFKDVWVLQEIYQDGRKVGEAKYLAQIIRYSADEDIAILKLYKKGWNYSSAKFSGRNYIPKSGDAIWHIGSMYGVCGHNTLSDGVVSTPGRLRWRYRHNDAQGIIYDQITFTGHPGSSGGGIFDKSTGQCLGLVTEFVNRGMYGCLCITPTRRLWRFAERTHCLWAMTTSEQVPDEIVSVVDKELPALPPPPAPKKKSSSVPPTISELLDIFGFPFIR